MIDIVTLNQITFDNSLQKQFRELFFITSARKSFASEEEKEQFFQKWTAFYFANSSEYIYLALKDGELLGYLTGHPHSAQCRELYLNNFTFAIFEDYHFDFPAHLHINCHPQSARKGIGRKLIDRFCSDLSSMGIGGVHIVTSPVAENVLFYQKCGFDFRLVRNMEKNFELLFMGKRIVAQS